MKNKSRVTPMGIGSTGRPPSGSRGIAGKERLRSERGQGMTEYIILVVLVALVCMPVAQLLPRAAKEYLRPFYYSVSRPIP